MTLNTELRVIQKHSINAIARFRIVSFTCAYCSALIICSLSGRRCYSVNDLFMNNRNPTEPCEMCGYAIHNMRLRNTVFVNTRFSRADA